MRARRQWVAVIGSMCLGGVLGCDDSQTTSAPPAGHNAATPPPSSPRVNPNAAGQPAGDAAPSASAADRPEPNQGSSQPARPSGGGFAPELVWRTPQGWVEVETTSPMRLAEFKVPAAEGDADEVSLIVFFFGPGGGGGAEANLARWRDQMVTAEGAPLPDEAVTIETSERGGFKFSRLEAKGAYGGMQMPGQPAAPPAAGYMLIGVVVEGDGGPWFVKLVGPAASVEAARGNLKAFLDSLSLQ